MLVTALQPISRQPGDTRRTAETRAVARAVASLNLTPDIAHTPDGAPFLTSHPDLTLSVSHSLTTVAVAVADHPVGIDIEAPRQQLAAVAERFLDPDEQQAANGDINALLRAWTAKEAVYKTLRRTAVDFARDIRLIDNHTAIFVPTGVRLSVQHYPQPDGQILAIATFDTNTQ